MSARSVVYRMVWKEPLVHFIALGGLVFAVQHLWFGNEPEVIVVSRAAIDELAAGYQERMGSPPSPRTLQEIVDGHVRNEVLYRQALKANLDQGDHSIRKRLISRFLILEMAKMDDSTPSDAELRAFLQRNASKYKLPGRFDFEHYLATGPAASKQVVNWIAQLNRAEEPDPQPAKFSWGTRFKNESTVRIKDVFGERFMRGLTQRSQTRKWFAVESDHGWHAVRIKQFANGKLPTFDQVRTQLESDMKEERKRAEMNARVDRWLKEYEVVRDDDRP